MSCTAVIVGAGSGIGAAIARRLATPGADLFLHTGSARGRLDAVADACRDTGAGVETGLGDTADERTFHPIKTWLEGRTGHVTAAIFAAGYAKLGKLSDASNADLEAALGAMPAAFHRFARLAAPHLADGRGRVIAISAFGAHAAKRYTYTATAPAKAALEAQVRAFAVSLAPRAITVNAIVPGFIRKDPGTPSSLTAEQWAQTVGEIPMSRLGLPEEAAALAAFLMSHEAGYITGQAIRLDGGLTL